MKKKHKPTKKRQAQGASRSKKGSSGTTSNWDMTVRAATGGQTEASPAETSGEMVRGEFTPGEIGQIGRLDQEGEGNRQNAEAQELEEIEPGKDIKPH
jgi:hypothetical protein